LITSPNGPQPAGFSDVRAANLAVVLRFVRENAPCSRADIAASTGLNKATVSSLVADLIDRRLLREVGQTENRVGRPATMLVLDGSPYAAIGIEVNADRITAVAVDLKGERLLDWRRAFPGGTSSESQAVAAVAGVARRAVNRMAKEGRQVLGLAVAVPGLVDADGSVRAAPSLGWRDVNLCADLTKALRDPGFPVLADNDANLAALAERRFGPYGNVGDLVFLTGEAGVGAGVIMDGRLRRGARGHSGEIGHIEIDAAGPPCHCGRRGCLEAMAGIGAILSRIRARRPARRVRAGDRGGRPAGEGRGPRGPRAAGGGRARPRQGGGDHREPARPRGGDPRGLLRPARAVAGPGGRGGGAAEGAGPRRLPAGGLDARARGGRPRWRRPRRRLGRLREVTGAGRRLTRPGDRRALPPAAGSAGGRKPPGRRARPRPTRRPGG